jgi:hypothetical protein
VETQARGCLAPRQAVVQDQEEDCQNPPLYQARDIFEEKRGYEEYGTQQAQQSNRSGPSLNAGGTPPPRHHQHRYLTDEPFPMRENISYSASAPTAAPLVSASMRGQSIQPGFVVPENQDYYYDDGPSQIQGQQRSSSMSRSTTTLLEHGLGVMQGKSRNSKDNRDGRLGMGKSGEVLDKLFSK